VPEPQATNSRTRFAPFPHVPPERRPGPLLALTGADEAETAAGRPDTYRHDAWGVLLGRTGSTVNPHTYIGRERYYRMPNAEMYHLGFRDYAQGVGRFTTVDPLRYSANWYQYVMNQTCQRRDPLGLLILEMLRRLAIVLDVEAHWAIGGGRGVLLCCDEDCDRWYGEWKKHCEGIIANVTLFSYQRVANMFGENCPWEFSGLFLEVMYGAFSA